MSDDKSKKMASLIVGNLDGSTEPSPEKDGAQQDDSVASESAAEELISAIHSKSAKEVVDSMKNLWAILDKDENEEESAPESEQE